MRNISKLKATWKVIHQKHYMLSAKNRLSKQYLAAFDKLWAKLEKAKTKVGKPSPKSMQLQPVQNNKMKKSIYILTATTFMAMAFLTGCDTPTHKEEMVQQNVTDSAKIDQAQADEAYLADMKNYRKGTIQKLTVYNKNILALKAGMENQKQENKADCQNSITALEQRSSAVKMKMDNFQEGGKENWEAFKTELNQEMDALNKALSDSTAVKAL